MTDPAPPESTAALVHGVYRQRLGAFQLTIVHDGYIPTPTAMFAVNAEEGAADDLLRQHGLPTGTVHTPMAILIVQTGDRTVLFDTGLGDQHEVGSESGRLVPTMRLLGIAPESVTDLVISHFHPDHLGAVSIDGALSFPNAHVHFPKVEWDFLNGPAVGNETADAFIAQA